MTTLGKILVFLVFVAALGMGGLMLYASKAAPSWREAVQERDEKVIPVYKAMLEQEAESRKKLLLENQKLKRDLDNRLAESNGSLSQLRIEIDDAKKQASIAALDKDKAVIIANQAQNESLRLQKELAYVQSLVGEREKTIVKVQDDLATSINAKLSAENDLQTLKNRLQGLVEQLRVKDQQIAKIMKDNQPASGVVAGGGPRDANYLNPPPVMVKGQIELVDKEDKTLVKISIGSDAGIRKDQTLEVYRLNPEAKYLGRLVIVDADFRHSIAKLLRQPGVPAATLQPGDEVASKLR